MNDPHQEQSQPARDDKVIRAAIELATINIAKTVMGAIKDRNGTPEDVITLLARVNAVVLTTLTENAPEARVRSEELANMLRDNSLDIMRHLRAKALIRNLKAPKGLRP